MAFKEHPELKEPTPSSRTGSGKQHPREWCEALGSGLASGRMRFCIGSETLHHARLEGQEAGS